MMNVRKIESLETLLHYQSDWSDLLEKKRNTNPFIEFEWVYEWWKHFGEQSVEILAVCEQGAVIGFVPFAISRKNFTTIYQFIGNGKANYMDVVAEDDNVDRIIRFVFNEILRNEKNVVFHLHGLLGTNQTYETIKLFTKEQELPFSSYHTITPFINLSDLDIDSYMKKRSKLHGLNRREKKLRKLERLSISTCPPESIDEVFNLHEKRWKKRYDTSRFTEKIEREFFRSLSQKQEDHFSTKIDSLYIGSKMIAFHYGFCCRGRYVLYTLGHDDDFELFSPGRILEKELIIKSHRDGMKNYDMSIGYEAYKLDWATDREYTRKTLFSSKHPIARLIRAKLNMNEKIKEKLKSNYKLVMYKRNVLGRIRYQIRQLFKRNTAMNRRKVLSNVRKRIFSNKKYSIYTIDVNEIVVGKDQNLFSKLTLHDALNCEELTSAYSEICRMFYNGYEGYYPKGNLNYESIYWINERSVRIDEISYQENLTNNTLHLLLKQGDNIDDFINFLVKTKKTESIVLTIKKDSFEILSSITKWPIRLSRQINGKETLKKGR